MGNNLNCDSCSDNSRNRMHQREMMNQREMMYQRNMRMDRKQMNNRSGNCGCDACDTCQNTRVNDNFDRGCERNRNRCDDDCSRGRDMLYGVPLAMGYVPWQNFECTYEPAQALQAGTIFPELDKPFYGRRGLRL